MARRCEWKILQCHQKGLFLSFRDVATGPDQGKYLMAPNAARKLFPIEPIEPNRTKSVLVLFDAKLSGWFQQRPPLKGHVSIWF